jgi:hypothetical protein
LCTQPLEFHSSIVVVMNAAYPLDFDVLLPLVERLLR